MQKQMNEVVYNYSIPSEDYCFMIYSFQWLLLNCISSVFVSVFDNHIWGNTACMYIQHIKIFYIQISVSAVAQKNWVSINCCGFAWHGNTGEI